MIARNALEALTTRPSAFLRSMWPWRSLAYLSSSVVFAGVAVALVYVAYRFSVTIGCLLGGVVLVVLGLPLARFERLRLRLVDAAPARDPHQPPGRPGLTAWLGNRLREQATWRELGFAMVALAAIWCVDLGVISVSVWIPFLLLSAPLQPEVDSLLTALPISAAGLVLLPLAAYPVTAWAGARALIVRAVLAPREAEIIRSRARLVDAYESERRRIERDLHDGAQQRLVALTMKLGLAGLDLPPGSPAAVQVEEARVEAMKALAELRELIRGVHPQVLTDRGLTAAVRDVAGRSPVSVDVDLSLAARPSASVEATAYYVVCEALANVAKHSGATRCSVRGRMSGGRLVVEVGDDGVGGADPDRGSGLAGLADRLAVIDGTMTLSSPRGGPTCLRVEIPCPASA
ncbi:sensor histidine kinase [Nonomuraea jiangxiensis]|uniref:histidine kinase n=1 Tax=Nonomuraea jiangxiensis TaxID=633440 RepID=A0A1G9BGW2_9ACTN|nr:sensor domain-containing protein [Nonomuraea jiangxiensis]SDK38713.1 Signal transduction histidine kinase [Nonomuraea jiangxiensis]